MTWTAKFKQDTKAPGIGTVSAQWATPEGQSLLVETRIDEKTGSAALKAICDSKLAEYQAQWNAEATVSDKLTAVLNG